MLGACQADVPDQGSRHRPGVFHTEPPIVTQTLEVEIASLTSLRDIRATAAELVMLWSWEVDGADAQIAEPVVPAHLLWPGQVWTATAFSEDGVFGSASVTVPDPPGGNVLILLLDDIGIDKVGAYGASDSAPPTPRIDALAAEGVRFDRAYSSPVCSPTRGIVLTGRHARRTGLGWIVDTGSKDYVLPLEATTFAEALDETHGPSVGVNAIGKWHVAGPKADDWLAHPNAQGFDWYEGSPGNPQYKPERGYWLWDKNTNGVLSESDVYMTTATVDDTLARIDVLDEPWTLYVPFNAAHTPLSVPPDHLHTQDVDESSSQRELFDAVVEALDTEIGRLLDSMDPEILARTTVLTVGDNGTPDHAVGDELDPDQQKHTVYEGGIHVPFIVTGPHVTGPATSDALVHVADIFATTMEIQGVPLTGTGDLVLDLDSGPIPIDGRSLLGQLADPELPLRELLYAEGFSPNGAGPFGIDRRILRNERYKLMRLGPDTEHFFDLSNPDQLDGEDLLAGPLDAEQQAAFDTLTAALDDIAQTVLFEGF